MSCLSLRGATLALVALWALPAPGCPSEQSHPARPLARLQDREWVARHEQLAAQSRNGNIDVLFLGDSITHFWEGPGREAWETLLPLRPGNYGMAGDQTGHVLWRITIGRELDGLAPAAVVLLIGTNNLDHGHAPEDVAAGVGAIVRELRRQQPAMKVLLLGILPRSPRPEDRHRGPIRRTNELLRKLVNGKDVVYKDIGSRLLQADGTLSPDVMPDYWHLGPRGYAIWADAIRGDLQEMVRRK